MGDSQVGYKPGIFKKKQVALKSKYLQSGLLYMYGKLFKNWKPMIQRNRCQSRFSVFNQHSNFFVGDINELYLYIIALQTKNHRFFFKDLQKPKTKLTICPPFRNEFSSQPHIYFLGTYLVPYLLLDTFSRNHHDRFRIARDPGAPVSVPPKINDSKPLKR